MKHEELRIKNMLLRYLKEKGLTDDDAYKRLLRDVRAEQNNEPDIKYTWFSCDYSGCIEKITFPKGWAPWRARVHFVKHDYIPRPIPSMYDCTGRKWTHRFRTTVQHGQVVIYHYISVDL